MESIRDSKVPYAYIQFFNAFRDEIVIKRFISGLNQLLTQLIPKTKKAMLKITELISHAKLSVNITGVKAGVELTPISKNTGDIIEGLLKDIDKVLKEKEEQAVIFFDEFQDIVESDISDELQSIVRDFAQLTDHVIFIISGSHRHMLLKIFDDSNKPFFKLFDRIDLKRIHIADYQSFIQKLAKDQWGKHISDETMNEILNLTECHAYYVNRLCSKIWGLETYPMFKDVHRLWKQLVEEEFASIANDLSALTKNQRIVLQEICKYSILTKPNSTKFLQQVRLSPRSVTLAIDSLEKTDHIEKVGDGFRVIDSVIKYILAE